MYNLKKKNLYKNSIFKDQYTRKTIPCLFLFFLYTKLHEENFENKIL